MIAPARHPEFTTLPITSSLPRRNGYLDALKKRFRCKTNLCVLVVTCSLAGCATDGPSEETGMLIGGVLGGLIGHEIGGGSGQTATTIIGTIAGSQVGRAIGRSIDETDRLRMGTSLETVRSGVTSEWRNPDKDASYAFTPIRTMDSPGGPCREFSLNAEIGGASEQVYGTACRQTDGSWKIAD